jgi:hypothetical protein
MTWIVETAYRDEIAQAIEAATAGSEASDAGAELVTVLSTGSKLKLYRSDVLSATLTFASAWTNTSGVVSPPATTATYATADIDTGTWRAELTTSADAVVLTSTSVGPLGATVHDVTLSMDTVNGETTASISGGITFEYDSGEQVGIGPLTLGNAYQKIFPDVNFSAMTSGGREALVNSYWVTGSNDPLSTTPDTGYVGTDEIIRLGRVADPTNAARTVFRITRVDGDPEYTSSPSLRTEIAGIIGTYPLVYGTEYWFGYAVRVPAANAASALIQQIHSELSPSSNPMNSMFINSSGALSYIVRWSTNHSQGTWDPNQRGSATFATPAVTRSEWQYFAIKIKLSPLSSDSPYTTIYRAQGSAAPSLWFDHQSINAYYGTTQAYWKFGQYWMADPDATTGTQIDSYVRGHAIWKVSDVPTATAQNIINFMRDYP